MYPQPKLFAPKRGRKVRFYAWCAAGAVTLALLTALTWSSMGEASPVATSVRVLPDAPPPPMPADTFLTQVPIRRGDTFGTLLSRFGLPANAIRRAALDAYDLARIRPGHDLVLSWIDGTATPSEVRYRIDEDRTVIVAHDGDAWSAVLDEVQYTSEVGARDLTVDSSLWNQGLAAGLRPIDLVTMAEVFEYELDFNTEIRPGARFSVVADVLSAPDRDPRLGTLHALRLENGGNVYTAIRHTDAAGKDAWYHPDGKSMKRPFLRSPLAFDARVTSSFGRRFHPIKKQYSVHLGTDFGARTGTPVRAVADGVVKYAAWNGGHGRYVKLDHEGGAKTSYSHLSAIAVKNGQRVKQGQVIGKVGSTGYSTGPHLHYQLWVGGKLVDALKAKLPHQAPLPSSERAAFATRVAEVLPVLPGVTVDELEKAGLDPDDVELAVADRGE